MPGKRSQHLLNMIENVEGFGFDVNLPPGDWEQKTYWLRNRWPRVVFENPGIWELTQQWVIRDNVVIQQFVFRNFTDSPLTINYSTVLRLLIRELNFANPDNSFNNRTNENHDVGPGPGGYGLVNLYGLSVRGEHQNEHGDKERSSEIPSTDLNPDAVAAVMGCFINGEALMEGTYWEGSVTTLPKGVSRFVAGYKLVLLSTQRESWKQLLLTKEDVDIDGFLWKTQPPTDIPLDAFLFNEPFYVGRNVEHILTVCAMPITEGPVWDYEA
ncbi:hypothetical protein EIK77_010356 [Talaromyces pinophilus]|nr:hypothetical protein EIK77_010356 [Talaromyces pinophilus]